MNETQKPNILLVDDRPENLLALESLLEDLDLNIVKATSGNEALGLTLEYDFALFLIDVQMPDMDGMKATKAIRKTEEELRPATRNPQLVTFQS
jgi:CheY-like chemotaxis protein